MKHIIQTENYLLVVDDSEIKEGDYTFQEASNFISKYNNAYSKKIIAHLPLNGSSILDGVDLLPPIFIHYENGIEEYEKSCNQLYKEWLVIGYKSGYNKAKEKYKYTEDDLSKALSYGYHTAKDEYKGIPSSGYFTRFMQSLQQQKMPIGFESEIEKAEYWYLDGNKLVKPKTITNSQGINEWVGTYHY